MKVLLVIDGSKYSKMVTNALSALKLPQQTDVRLMTVVTEQDFLSEIPSDIIKDVGKDRKSIRELLVRGAYELLQKAANTLGTEFHVEMIVRLGDPSEQILDVVNDTETSLIIMGAKGLRDSKLYPLGSVTNKVIRHAEASVLVVKREIKVVERVLLAIDGSKYSDILAHFLLSLPLPKETELAVLTSVKPVFATRMTIPILEIPLIKDEKLLDRLQEQRDMKAKTVIEKIKIQFQTMDYEVTPVIMAGDASEDILLYADEFTPSFIAVGAKGLTGIDAFLLGSVAERIVTNAQCSVLIGRQHE